MRFRVPRARELLMFYMQTAKRSRVHCVFKLVHCVFKLEVTLWSNLRNLLRLLHGIRTVQWLCTKVTLAHDTRVCAVADNFHHLRL